MKRTLAILAVFIVLAAGVALAQEVKELEKQFTAVLKEASPKTVLVINAKPGTKRQICGSGAVISADGLILTCSHVVPVRGGIKVKLSDGKTYKAKLMGQNYLNDYALIKIEAKDLAYFKLGESARLKVGQVVMTLGFPGGPNKENRPKAGYGKVVGLGRNIPVQGFERYYPGSIKTDVKSRPGSSGGPLITKDGKLAGINGAILLFVERTYAIPVDSIKEALPKLKAGKDIEGKGIPSLPDLLKELQNELTPEELRKFYEELGKRFKETNPQKMLENFKKLFGEEFDLEKMQESFKKMLGDTGDGITKALEGLLGEEEFKRMKKELEKAFEDPETMQELEKQVQKAIKEFEKLFGGKNEGQKKEEKKKVEPPEGSELDKEIDRMLELLKKRVQEREKKEKEKKAKEELEKKLEKEIDKAFGKPDKKTSKNKKPYIGIKVSEPDEALRYQLGIKDGLVVDEIAIGSAAQKAGLKAGDIICRIGGKAIASFNDLEKALEGKKPGDVLTLTVIVRGTEKQFTLRLGAK